MRWIVHRTQQELPALAKSTLIDIIEVVLKTVIGRGGYAWTFDLMKRSRREFQGSTLEPKTIKSGICPGTDPKSGYPLPPPPGMTGVPPYNPVRIALDIFIGAWRAKLIKELDKPEPPNKPNSIDIRQLWQTLALRSPRARADFINKRIWNILKMPDPGLVLTIDAVQPPTAWTFGQSARVRFSLKNNSNQPTSGLVHGTATQGELITLASAHWFQAESIVTNLLPGETFQGTILFRYSTAWSRSADLVDFNLDYWIKDDNGTITFLLGLPGEQTSETYSAVSFATTPYSAPITFKTDIRPMFRQFDIDQMNRTTAGIDLSSYRSVSLNAQDIYDYVSTGRMPCDLRWSSEWVATFKLWMEEGKLP